MLPTAHSPISTKMKHTKIAFIGGGNMARSIIGGLVNANTPTDEILVAEPCPETRGALEKRFGITTFAENSVAAEQADVLVLAVKPQVMREVLLPLASIITQRNPLLISVAAGITSRSIERWSGGNSSLVRVMPNTPALISAGISALYANAYASEPQRNLAESIMRAVGTTVWISDESLMDSVTAVSGSGPAYFFYVMEALEHAAIKEGLDADTARLLTIETALGAARLALESNEGPGELREQVTSPRGTTEAAIAMLDSENASKIFEQAVSAAGDRSRELATLLDED